MGSSCQLSDSLIRLTLRRRRSPSHFERPFLFRDVGEVLRMGQLGVDMQRSVVVSGSISLSTSSVVLVMSARVRRIQHFVNPHEVKAGKLTLEAGGSSCARRIKPSIG